MVGMTLRVTATVTIRIENDNPIVGLGGASSRPGAVIEQSVTRTATGPNERYCYPAAEDAIDEVAGTVLTMMEAAYGKAERHQ